MKETGLLNREISDVISRMGLRDKLCICDAGLSIPSHVKNVDISLAQNKPRFLEVLEEILKHFSVEKVIIAEETKTVSPTMFNSIVESFDENVEIELIPHSELMKKREGVKAMIRTGEFTAYSNVILVSGADLSKWVIENG